LLRFGDPTVEYGFCGSTLRLPLSHALPFFRRISPLYSDNLGRIAAQLRDKFGTFGVIDVGANIGDTVVVIHHHAPLPILCIEGLPKFGELLTQNVAATLPAPVIERSFVGTGGEGLAPVVQDGTARLAYSAVRSSAIRLKSIDQILGEHPEFQNSRLLKIDTDGMDIAILNSALDWISRQKPVLFFEYDPDLQLAHGAGGLEMLGRLKRVGYQRVLVYEGNGDYMFSAELGNDTLFFDLHEYLSGRNRAKWCDLCIFHAEDEELAKVIRRNELDVFRAARQYLPARGPDQQARVTDKSLEAEAGVH
jgi:FkbM family methyltransferase